MDTLIKADLKCRNKKVAEPQEKKELNILLIEDSPGDARLIDEQLKGSTNYQFNITKADSIKNALSIIKDKGAEFFEIFDAVLLDLGLPDCIGTKSFKKIKDKLGGVPIIITTGSVLERNDLRLCLEGSSGFLVKGYVDSITLENAIISGIDKQKEHERVMYLINHKQEIKVGGWEKKQEGGAII